MFRTRLEGREKIPRSLFLGLRRFSNLHFFDAGEKGAECDPKELGCPVWPIIFQSVWWRATIMLSFSLWRISSSVITLPVYSGDLLPKSWWEERPEFSGIDRSNFSNPHRQVITVRSITSCSSRVVPCQSLFRKSNIFLVTANPRWFDYDLSWITKFRFVHQRRVNHDYFKESITYVWGLAWHAPCCFRKTEPDTF